MCKCIYKSSLQDHSSTLSVRTQLMSVLHSIFVTKSSTYRGVSNAFLSIFKYSFSSPWLSLFFLPYQGLNSGPLPLEPFCQHCFWLFRMPVLLFKNLPFEASFSLFVHSDFYLGFISPVRSIHLSIHPCIRTLSTASSVLVPCPGSYSWC